MPPLALHSGLPDRYLLHGGHVYSPSDPFATAMLIIDGRVAWIGSDAGAAVHSDSVEAMFDLDGSLVTPAFVDAHVHLTALGLSITGLDLSGIASSEELLRRLADAVEGQPLTSVIWGHGWDDSGWSSAPPTREQIDAASGGRAVFLSRVDAHSALVSSALVDRNPDVRRADGFDPEGIVTRDANLILRAAASESIPDKQRQAAQRAALERAASRGIASVHEMGGPGISSAIDLASALSLGQDPDHVEVIGYWGEILGLELAAELGAHGCAGDLFVDGSLGSHTACLREPYADDATTSGVAYLETQVIAEHIRACTEAGIQAGFHVIGDAAMDRVIAGLSAAAQHVGDEALRRCGHRVEHAEMLDAEAMNALSRWGVTASMQPSFDAAWGGAAGMYVDRLGPQRARAMNPFASVLQHGVPLAFGSDAPVTALEPWEAVRAAAFHHQSEHRVSTRAAFAAHTRGGRRAARQESREPGVLQEGAPATFAVWTDTELRVIAPDDRISAWSTDPRSGTPGLPDLTPGVAAPLCRGTVRAGRVIFDGTNPGEER